MLGYGIAGIVLLLIMISIIVSFHEYGHYSVARLFNTRIDRFSIRALDLTRPGPALAWLPA